jgi:hypothetical protein
MEYYYYQFRTRKYVLPIQGALPSIQDDAMASSYLPLLHSLSEKCSITIDTFSNARLLTPVMVQKELSKLYRYFCQATGETRQMSKEVFIELNENFTIYPTAPLDKFKIYDDYFDVVRYDAAPPIVFVDQLLLALRSQICDLANSQVAYSELQIGVKAMATMLSLLCQKANSTIDTTHSLIELSAISPNINLSDPDAAAIERWKVGHITFAYNLMFSIDELQNAMSSSNPEQHILNAANLFRASTAAMWYASVFSAKTYMEVIRPSMVSTKAPGGFSGHQNREFAKFKRQKDIFFNHYGNNEIDNPLLIKSLKRFADIYLQDGEQHILLAAAMVEDKTSLVQDDVTKQYGIRMCKSAVELLRDIQMLRSQEIEFINDLIKII